MEASSSTSPFEDIPLNSENHQARFFTSFDYALFGVMLLVSAAIGIYFGFFAKRKQDNTTEYLLGGKKMKFFPIAASLIASHINGFTMLAVPAEVYAHGSEYSLCVISAVLVSSLPFCRHPRECGAEKKKKERWKIYFRVLLAFLDGRRSDLRISAGVLRSPAHVIVPVSREALQSKRATGREHDLCRVGHHHGTDHHVSSL